MAINCSNTTGPQILAQQLFLGASINGFSFNMGWGGSPSSLSVELVNDWGSVGECNIVSDFDRDIYVYQDSVNFSDDNHYYTCVGDDCYIDERGRAFNPTGQPPSQERRIPGKVYHILNNNGVVSQYWKKHDPGFFGDATVLDPNGVRTLRTVTSTTNGTIELLPFRYNIIGVPVYFRYGYFTFGGIIQSWEKSITGGLPSYSVNIASADDLLSRCYLILNNYTGSIFSSFNKNNDVVKALNGLGVLTGNDLGSPTNYTGTSAQYKGSLIHGNIPNIFNIYGFLESYGFGLSEKNDQGIPIDLILRALPALTSASNKDLGIKGAFSPFGRIIAPIPLTDASDPRDKYYNQPTNANFGLANSFGLFDIVNDVNNVPRCEFTLDISDLPVPPRNIRLDSNSDVISILDFIRQVCDKTGRDFYTTVIRKGGLNVIKIKTINRTIQVASNTISSVVQTLANNNIKATSASIGQEHNVATPKVLYIGANQQRLYQTKNYLFGYSQSNYIYHPSLNQFIDIKDISNYKIPSVFSTRHLTLCKEVLKKEFGDTFGTTMHDLFANEQKIIQEANSDFEDISFEDTDVSTGCIKPIIGNYGPTIKYDDTSLSTSKRYIPLWKNSISPFFGYTFNESIDIDTSQGSNAYRFIRPVYYDNWTGQQLVAMSLDELPVLSIGRTPSVYTYRQLAGLPIDGEGNNMQGARNLGITPNDSNQTIPPALGQVRYDRDTDSQTNSPLASTTRPGVDFVITESEMRAAMQGWENYLSYCFAKLSFSKPDLFVMLTYAYTRLGKLFGPEIAPLTTDIGGSMRGPRVPIANVNVAGEARQNNGQPQISYKQLNLNFNIFLNHEFIKDFKILSDFVASIGNNFYGKKYLVRLPEVKAYRDTQNPDIKINLKIDRTETREISVYQGSAKIYFDYEPTTGAWEEMGNFIDGEIVVGSPNYYKLIDNNNLIKPLLGYNASYNRDIMTEKWCEIEQNAKKELLDIVNTNPDDMGAIAVPVVPNQPVETNSNKQNSSSRGGPINVEKAKRSFAMAQLNKYGWNIENCGTKYVPSLELSDLSDYVLTNVPGKIRDAFGNTLAGIPRQKLYTPVNIESDLAFADPINLIGPFAILDGPGIDLHNTSQSYATDPNLTVISNAASEDLAFIKKMNTDFVQVLTAAAGVDYGRDIALLEQILTNSIVAIDHEAHLLPEGDTSNQQYKHITISPKKAQPIFAGVPLKSNTFCYGPWTNYSSIIDRSKLFPNLTKVDHISEQLISDVKIEKNNDFAPWNYGGMAFLDVAVIYEMLNNISYQTRLEQGSISIASLPLFGLAGNMDFNFNLTDSDTHTAINDTFMGLGYSRLVYCPNDTNSPPNRSPDNYNGLVISNMGINLSNTISTTYNFRTYSPKLGLFNKENSDRLKEFSSSVLSFNKKLADTTKNLENSTRKQIKNIIENSKTDRLPTNTASYQSKIYAASPTQLLIGKSSYYIPFVTEAISTTGMSNSWAGMYVPDEALAELTKEFSSKSVMSMDGLFSPVSLYPTNNNSTFSISSRTVTNGLLNKSITCPRCDGTGQVQMAYVDSNTTSSWPVTTQDLPFPCPLCSKSKILPFDDSSNLITNDSTSEAVINFNTLNPLCLSTGEFRNINAQPEDAGRYNIRAIGRSDVLPTNDYSLDSFTNINNKEIASGLFGEVDDQYEKLYNIKILNNHRFFAFRGPLMLHGWGYDIDGNPVPNKADEPKEYDTEGRPKRFILTSSGTNDLTQDGAFLPLNGKQVGDIIGQGWEKNGEGWTKTSTNKFYMNWAERPDLWPIGPIDLRWDYNNKIWTAGGGGGCNNADPPYIVASGTSVDILSQFVSTTTKANKKCSYKMIYGILEEDLRKSADNMESFPARAFLDDLEYGLSPLPENVRRLIYIVDKTGYSAPRGAKLLVRYNIDTGFYEPVTKQQYIVGGTIVGQYVTLKLEYMPGYQSGDSSFTTTVQYNNPLELDIKTRGIFIYNNSSWDLISTG